MLPLAGAARGVQNTTKQHKKQHTTLGLNLETLDVHSFQCESSGYQMHVKH